MLVAIYAANAKLQTEIKMAHDRCRTLTATPLDKIAQCMSGASSQLRRMASSRFFQLLRRQWAFLAPQPSEDLLSLQLCFVCLELLFVGPVSGVGGGACALCMFLQ